MDKYIYICMHIYHFEIYVLGSQEDGTECDFEIDLNDNITFIDMPKSASIFTKLTNSLYLEFKESMFRQRCSIESVL